MSAMTPETAHWLVDGSAEAMRFATELGDPDSLATATALRRELPPERAAAVLTQLGLRRRARTKFADRADPLWFTPAGLEQATRPEVARWRAHELAAQGITAVVDLGCGLGIDAMAMREAGLGVRAVERDPVTAVLAEANLGLPVRLGDAESIHLGEDEAAFCDPARRTSSGRLWRVEDFSPSWSFVGSLLERPQGACIKLGPALPHRLIPAGVDARWVSHRREVVEASLWRTPGRGAADESPADRNADGARSAVLLDEETHELVADGRDVPVAEVGEVIAEPDGALIRSGGVGTLAARLGLTRLEAGLAYLSTDRDTASSEAAANSPWLTWFTVSEILPCKEKPLRRWVRENDIGTLEIKKRGVDLDPAALRRRLRPSGPNSATLILTPTPAGARALVVARGLQPPTS